MLKLVIFFENELLIPRKSRCHFTPLSLLNGRFIKVTVVRRFDSSRSPYALWAPDSSWNVCAALTLNSRAHVNLCSWSLVLGATGENSEKYIELRQYQYSWPLPVKRPNAIFLPFREAGTWQP